MSHESILHLPLENGKGSSYAAVFEDSGSTTALVICTCGLARELDLFRGFQALQSDSGT